MKTFAVAAFALLIASPAIAQPTGNQSGQNGQAQSSSEAPAERQVCRRIEDASGSRSAARRVCMTAQEWREHERNNRN